MRSRKQESEVLTIIELLKMSKADRRRRGKAASKRPKAKAKKPDADYVTLSCATSIS